MRLSSRFRIPLRSVLIFALCALAEPASAQSEATQAAASASGIVFKDSNRNRQRDAGEPGLAGVLVSNGLEVGRIQFQPNG